MLAIIELTSIRACDQDNPARYTHFLHSINSLPWRDCLIVEEPVGVLSHRKEQRGRCFMITLSRMLVDVMLKYLIVKRLDLLTVPMYGTEASISGKFAVRSRKKLVYPKRKARGFYLACLQTSYLKEVIEGIATLCM